jgi:hypothetical protein
MAFQARDFNVFGMYEYLSFVLPKNQNWIDRGRLVPKIICDCLDALCLEPVCNPACEAPAPHRHDTRPVAKSKFCHSFPRFVVVGLQGCAQLGVSGGEWRFIAANGGLFWAEEMHKSGV